MSMSDTLGCQSGDSLVSGLQEEQYIEAQWHLELDRVCNGFSKYIIRIEAQEGRGRAHKDLICWCTGGL